jgi:predicted aconitase
MPLHLAESKVASLVFLVHTTDILSNAQISLVAGLFDSYLCTQDKPTVFTSKLKDPSKTKLMVFSTQMANNNALSLIHVMKTS